MKLVLLGTAAGESIQRDRCKIGLLIEVRGDLLLFDVGGGVTRRIAQVPVNLPDIDKVFFTHYHEDHMADYAEFVIASWGVGRRGPLHVWGPPGHEKINAVGIERITQMLFGSGGIHDADIVSRIELPGAQRDSQNRFGIPLDRPTFKVTEIRSPGKVYEGDSYVVSATFVTHSDFLHCLAYRVDSPDGSVAFSGDIGATDKTLAVFARDVDLLVHECTRFDDVITDLGWENSHTGPIALGKIADAAGVKRVVLTHFSAAVAGVEAHAGMRDKDALPRMVREVQQNFSGEVILGRDLLSIQL